MMHKFQLVILLPALLLSCTNFTDQVFKTEKKTESINQIELSISLTGNDFIQCRGIVKYGNVILNRFNIDSYRKENPSELIMNYSNSQEIAQQLAIDFVLQRKPVLEVFIENEENEFTRINYIQLDPKVPPIMTGIELEGSKITKKYPVRFKQEVYDIESYLLDNNISLNNYTLERIATVSLLIKNNTNFLPAVIPAGEDIPIYKGLKSLEASVYCDSSSLNPQLLLYPSAHNKYYDGPGFFQIINSLYTNKIQTLTKVILKGDKYQVSQNFNVEFMIGEYDLFLTIMDKTGNYFFYDLGSVVFDNVAPEFNEWSMGNYYFGGNGLFEGKVYLDYTIPVKQNPYDVIFSGKVFGDVKDIRIDGEPVSFVKDGDLLFKRKIYIPDGYKEVDVKLSDLSGNLKNYILPLIVSQ